MSHFSYLSIIFIQQLDVQKSNCLLMIVIAFLKIKTSKNSLKKTAARELSSIQNWVYADRFTVNYDSQMSCFSIVCAPTKQQSVIH